MVKDNLINDPKNRNLKHDLVDGNQSFLARYKSELLNELDQETYLRHSEIPDKLHIRLDFIRDFKNCLKLLSDQDYADYVEELEKDATRTNIAKLATCQFHQLNFDSEKSKGRIKDLLTERHSFQTTQIYNELGDGLRSQLPLTKTLEHFAFQVYIEIDVLQNGAIYHQKIFTGVKFSYELEDTLEIPIKICDLAPLSSLAISIFDMSRLEEEPIASTVIDLFDSKKRLRQGTWNCQLHVDKMPDLTTECLTPAITDSKTCVALNNSMQEIRMWRKKKDIFNTWIDRQSF